MNVLLLFPGGYYEAVPGTLGLTPEETAEFRAGDDGSLTLDRCRAIGVAVVAGLVGLRDAPPSGHA